MTSATLKGLVDEKGSTDKGKKSDSLLQQARSPANAACIRGYNFARVFHVLLRVNECVLSTAWAWVVVCDKYSMRTRMLYLSHTSTNSIHICIQFVLAFAMPK